MAGCQIHSLSPQIPYKRTHLILRPTNMNLNEQLVSAVTIKQSKIPKSDIYSVKFKTLGDCKLGISRYPDFSYNAKGGQGSGTATRASDPKDEVFVDFDVETLYIPPLSTATTKFLGLPLPPFLKIEIVPETFRGTIDQESGKVELKFRAKFLFSIGSVYKARPLLVDTVLTSEESKGEMRRGKGERVDKDGMCKLVGVAKVEPINDIFMDTFLSLPTECLASLNAIISFSA
ncbi:hypothetical protein CASFOL_008358 [Castilleja foliolosa]|uniref:Uncharacterized protein n=1 Tax=Castilleja foliolosa TaxID=1961234 RepID=A0ABD3DYR3_9LAMI